MISGTFKNFWSRDIRAIIVTNICLPLTVTFSLFALFAVFDCNIFTFILIKPYKYAHLIYSIHMPNTDYPQYTVVLISLFTRPTLCSKSAIFRGVAHCKPATMPLTSWGINTIHHLKALMCGINASRGQGHGFFINLKTLVVDFSNGGCNNW